jgi:hypothetical protein
MAKISNKNVSIAGFGMDCFSVIAPKGCDVQELTEFLRKSNACQRENIEFSHVYERETGETCYVFSESGAWKL